MLFFVPPPLITLSLSKHSIKKKKKIPKIKKLIGGADKTTSLAPKSRGRDMV